MRVTRPVVRSFKAAYAREAIAHVRQGGLAIFWESEKRARLVFQEPREGNDQDLGEWALLDLGKQRFDVETRGAFRGLATSLVPREHHDIVEGWVRRDSVWRGATRKVSFDCLECGACCRDNEVVLQKVDIVRFQKGGRPDLLKKPYARRRRDKKIVLTLLKSKDCRHLQKDNKCRIYPLRPDACSLFPVASECCLFAREEELGLVDGARD